MRSDFPNYGAILAKNVKLDRTGLIFVDSSDDSKTVTLKLKAGALSAGNVDVELPLSATELGGGGDIPDGSQAGQQLFWSGSAWAAQAVSGDVTADQSGAFTIANNAVESDMLVNNAVTSQKIQAQAVGQSAIENGAVTEQKLASGACTADKIASNACTADKIASNACTSDKIANDAVGASELGVTAGTALASKAMVLDASSDVAGVNELGLTTLAFGNDWRVQISGGNMVFQYSADGGSTWTTKQTFNNA